MHPKNHHSYQQCISLSSSWISMTCARYSCIYQLICWSWKPLCIGLMKSISRLLDSEVVHNHHTESWPKQSQGASRAVAISETHSHKSGSDRRIRDIIPDGKLYVSEKRRCAPWRPLVRIIVTFHYSKVSTTIFTSGSPLLSIHRTCHQERILRREMESRRVWVGAACQGHLIANRIRWYQPTQVHLEIILLPAPRLLDILGRILAW